MFHHDGLGTVPCAMEQDLLAYPFSMSSFSDAPEAFEN